MDFKITTIIGSLGLVVFPTEPQFYMMCAVVVSSVTAVILQILKGKREDKRDARDREERHEHQELLLDRYERQMRATEHKASEIRQEVATTAKTLRSDLHTNTVLTKEAAQKAERAFETANHVNEKIATLARGDVKMIEAVTQDTNDTVHRLEDKNGL